MKYSYSISALGIFLASLSNFSFSQAQLSLSGCMKTATENNLLVQQSRNNEEAARLGVVQAKTAFLPSVSTAITGNKYLGQSVDQFSLTVNENPWNGNFYGRAEIPLFNGLMRWHNLKSGELRMDAAIQATLALENDILSQVTLAYFQVIYDQDNLKITAEKLKLLEKQTERAEAQFKAGTKTQGDVYNVKSQLSTEKVNFISRENQLEKNLLTLIQLLDMDPSDTYELERPEGDFSSIAGEIPDVETLYSSALANFPDVKEKQLQLISAEENILSSKSALYPSLSMSFSSGTNYSSGRKEIILGPGGIPTYGDVIPFDNQISDYWTNGFSMTLGIPIFQNYRNKIAYQQSKVNAESARIGLEQAENQLIKEIQQAYLDLKAAEENFKASEENLLFLNESLLYMESKYEAGLIDFFSYMEVLNNKTSAETSRIQSGYNYILKRKILDLYMGKEISF